MFTQLVSSAPRPQGPVPTPHVTSQSSGTSGTSGRHQDPNDFPQLVTPAEGRGWADFAAGFSFSLPDFGASGEVGRPPGSGEDWRGRGRGSSFVVRPLFRRPTQSAWFLVGYRWSFAGEQGAGTRRVARESLDTERLT